MWNPVDEEFAIVAAPERAVTRHRKGHAMKALLLEKWGSNYAGQVLTNVKAGSIPAGVAKFYEDDAPTPNDVVKDPNPENAPLTVTNDSLDADEVDAASKAQAGKIDAAKVQADKAEKDAAEDAKADRDGQARAPKAKAKGKRK